MSDLIERKDAIDYFVTNIGVVDEDGYAVDDYDERVKIWTERFSGIPSAEPGPKWIPVTEALPEDKTWYLGIFKESDTGYCVSIPFVCYYAGRRTMFTTKDHWILRGYDSFSEYLENLECAAWMSLPKLYER